MGELKRKEDELSTADLVGRAESRPQEQTNFEPTEARGPRLVSEEIPQPAQPRAAGEAIPRNNRSAVNSSSPLLFSESDTRDWRASWSDVQTGFVDEPRRAVQEADKLVAAVMKRLAEGFANERSALEKQWDGGTSVSTEELRVALQRYRSFFDRLLNA